MNKSKINTRNGSHTQPHRAHFARSEECQLRHSSSPATWFIGYSEEVICTESTVCWCLSSLKSSDCWGPWKSLLNICKKQKKNKLKTTDRDRVRLIWRQTKLQIFPASRFCMAELEISAGSLMRLTRWDILTCNKIINSNVSIVLSPALREISLRFVKIYMYEWI